MKSFKFAVPVTETGKLSYGDGEILGKRFRFRHGTIGGKDPFEVEIRSNTLNRNDAFNAAVLLSSALCMVRLQKSVDLYPTNVPRDPNSDRFQYFAACDSKATQ